MRVLAVLWALLTGALNPVAPAARPTSAPAVRVRIAGFGFRPDVLTVAAGTRVRWVNRDIANHTVTFRRGPGDLGDIDRGRARATRFAHPGRYRYVCVYHPGMRGTVVVR